MGRGDGHFTAGYAPLPPSESGAPGTLLVTWVHAVVMAPVSKPLTAVWAWRKGAVTEATEGRLPS